MEYGIKRIHRPKKPLAPRLGNEVKLERIYKAVIKHMQTEKAIAFTKKPSNILCTLKIVNLKGHESVEVHLRIVSSQLDVDFYVPLDEWNKKVCKLRQTRFPNNSETPKGVFKVTKY